MWGYNLAVRLGPDSDFWGEVGECSATYLGECGGTSSPRVCIASSLLLPPPNSSPTPPDPENGYEPINSTYFRRYSIGQNHRPTPTGAIMSCDTAAKPRSMHVLGTHGHSHVMIPGSTDLEFLLHRRAPMEQTVG